MAMFLALSLLAISTAGLGAAQSDGVLLAGQTLPQVMCPLFIPRAAPGRVPSALLRQCPQSLSAVEYALPGVVARPADRPMHELLV